MSRQLGLSPLISLLRGGMYPQAPPIALAKAMALAAARRWSLEPNEEHRFDGRT
jgi:hypothetical protein